MEDIAPYTDEQVGAAARDVHAENARSADPAFRARAGDRRGGRQRQRNAPDGNPALVKYIGNVPASGKPPAGVLRHRGWRATAVSLPQLNSRSGSGRARAGGNRSGVTLGFSESPIFDRDRSRHHQLRARVHGDFGGRTEAGEVRAAPIPQLVNANEVRRSRCCRRSSTFRASAIFRQARSRCRGMTSRASSQASWRSAAARRFRAAWCRPPKAGCRIRRWTARRRCCRGRPPKGWRAFRPSKPRREYLKHLRAAWDRGTSRRAFRPTGRTGHRARVVRCHRARADGQGGGGGRISETSPCSKSRRPRSTRGSSGIPTGGSASARATWCWWSISAAAPPISP